MNFSIFPICSQTSAIPTIGLKCQSSSTASSHLADSSAVPWSAQQSPLLFTWRQAASHGACIAGCVAQHPALRLGPSWSPSALLLVSLELRCSHGSPQRITDSRLGCPPESRRRFEILNCEWDLVSGSRTRARVFWESPSSDSDDWVTAATGPQCLVNKPQLFYPDTLGTNFLLWALPPLFFAYPKVCPNWWWQSLFPECLLMLHLSLVCPWYPFFFISVSLNYNFYSRASLNETDLDKNTFKVLRIVLEC